MHRSKTQFYWITSSAVQLGGSLDGWLLIDLVSSRQHSIRAL